MFECSNCNREFKNKLGLVSHMKICKPKEDKSIESIDETNIVDSNSVSDSLNDISEIDIEKQRVKDKLKVTIRSCYDAETKARLEREYYALGGSRDELMK